MEQRVSAVLGSVLMAVMSLSPSFGQSPQDEPTKREIEGAYKSKSGGCGTFIPGVCWERWRIKEIRRWSLHFKRVSERRGIGILTRQYQAVAKKNGSCVEYQITDTMPFPEPNVQIKPILVVEPGGVTACR
jgi:hypothetical protein